MSLRKNCKSSDWLWVELIRSERAKQGKKTEFRFHGQICSDKKIHKNVARNVTSIDIINARLGNMPETPEGWVAMTPSASDLNPEYRAVSNSEQSARETFDIMGLSTTEVQESSVSDLTEEEYVLYGFLTNRRTSWDLIHGSSRHKHVASGLWKGFERYNQKILQAAAYGDANEIRLAIKHDANPSFTDPNGWTPLHYAAFYGHMEASRVLVEAGSTINKTCGQGKTPLDMTPESRLDLRFPTEISKSDINKFLLANGAKATVKTASGRRFVCVPTLDESEAVKQDNRKGTSRFYQCSPGKSENSEETNLGTSPMSWQYTALGAPEVLKESPYKLSRYLGLSTCSAAISIDGASYRSSAPRQASVSLRAILAKNSQGPHKSWATPPMHTPQL